MGLTKKIQVPDNLIEETYWALMGINLPDYQLKVVPDLKEWIDSHDGVVIHALGKVGIWLSFQNEQDYIEFKLMWK